MKKSQRTSDLTQPLRIWTDYTRINETFFWSDTVSLILLKVGGVIKMKISLGFISRMSSVQTIYFSFSEIFQAQNKLIIILLGPDHRVLVHGPDRTNLYKLPKKGLENDIRIFYLSESKINPKLTVFRIFTENILFLGRFCTNLFRILIRREATNRK